MKEYYYIVRYGFDSLSTVKVKAGADLEKVILAKMRQQPVEINGRIFDGKHIIDIRPDYHHYTGWYPNYQPSSGEDWRQIERDCPPQIEQVLSAYTNRVRNLLTTNQTHLVGKGEPIDIEALPQSGSSFAQKVLTDKSKQHD